MTKDILDMRSSFRIALLGSLVSVFVIPGLSYSQEVRQDTSDVGNTLQGGALPLKDEQLSVEACWDAWKTREGLDDGKNERNGYYILVSHQKSGVGEEVGSKNWLAGRNQAFNYAEISARAALAQSLRSTIQSSREAAVKTFGGDDAPQNLKPIVDQLSLADKSRTLVDKALDDEIKNTILSGMVKEATKAAVMRLLRCSLRLTTTSPAMLRCLHQAHLRAFSVKVRALKTKANTQYLLG